MAVIDVLIICIILFLYFSASQKESLDTDNVITRIFFCGLFLVILLILAAVQFDHFNAQKNAIRLINIQYGTDFIVDDWQYNKEIVEQILESKKTISEKQNEEK
jgi:hypothetical protein